MRGQNFLFERAEIKILGGYSTCEPIAEKESSALIIESKFARDGRSKINSCRIMMTAGADSLTR